MKICITFDYQGAEPIMVDLAELATEEQRRVFYAASINVAGLDKAIHCPPAQAWPDTNEHDGTAAQRAVAAEWARRPAEHAPAGALEDAAKILADIWQVLDRHNVDLDTLVRYDDPARLAVDAALVAGSKPVSAARRSAEQGTTYRPPSRWWRLRDRLSNAWFDLGMKLHPTRTRLQFLEDDVKALGEELDELCELESDLMRATFDLYRVFSTREAERAMGKRPPLNGYRSP